MSTLVRLFTVKEFFMAIICLQAENNNNNDNNNKCCNSGSHLAFTCEI